MAKIPIVSHLDQKEFAYIAIRGVDLWGGDTENKHYPHFNTGLAQAKKRIGNDESKCATIKDGTKTEVYFKILTQTHP